MLLSKRKNSDIPNVNLSYLNTFSLKQLGEFQLNIHSTYLNVKKIMFVQMKDYDSFQVENSDTMKFH